VTGDDYFEQLDSELSQLVRRAAHLEGTAARARRYTWLLRRATLAAIVILALAVTLISEFPSSASGAGPRMPVAAVGI
jgi:hypothetical protein